MTNKLENLLNQINDLHDAITLITTNDAQNFLTKIWVSDDGTELSRNNETIDALFCDGCICRNSFELDMYLSMLEDEISDLLYFN